MAIWYVNSQPFGFTPRRKLPPLDILKFIVTTFKNQDNKVVFIWVDEYGALARYYEFMKTCHNMNITFKNTGGDASYLNDKSEIPNKTLANITRALLLNSSHKKKLWWIAYHYDKWLSRKNENILRGDVPYFLCHGKIPSYKHIKYGVLDST